MTSRRAQFSQAVLTALRVAIVCTVLLPLQAWSQGSQPLRLVSTVWSPFTNAAGEARFALDLVEEALKRIGVTSDTTFVQDADFTSSLMTGRADGSAAAWKDAERERVLLFSDPYLENRLILVGRRGSDVTATTLAALAGKRLVIVGGYSYGDAVKNGSGPTFVQSSGEEDSLAKLLAGEADYTLMDELVVQYLVRNYPQQTRERLQLGTTPLIRRSLHLAIRRTRTDAISVIARFNAELRRMIADRTYHRLLHVDWLRADIDGDGRPELISRTDQAGLAPPT
ncbi:MAG TPA: transporter substrate-binding domain-containing protein, partial [Vicinamibacterales bacterium]|nr:transporter substrate-binding domain-containing protein [Vicinamibacterales bacterium]